MYGQHLSMSLGPYSIHQWRQSDCASMTHHYYSEDRPFLEPKMHWLGEKASGKTISDFPLLYYVYAQLWKGFGKSHFIYRIGQFLIFFGGMMALFLIFWNASKDLFWSVFLSLSVYLSPILVFYSNNFLTNVPSFSLALIALCFITKYWQTQKLSYLLIAFSLYTIAGLLKITALFSFLAFFPLVLYLYFSKKIKYFTYLGLCTLGLVFSILAWQSYVYAYNSENLSNVFLQGILPVWDASKEDRLLILDKLFTEHLIDWMPMPFLLLLGGIYLVIIFSKQIHKLKKLYLLTLSGGILLYVILFFRVFLGHDYYLINLLVIVPLVLYYLLLGIKNSSLSTRKTNILKSGYLLLFIYCAFKTSVINRMKYNTNQSWVQTLKFLAPQRQLSFYDWYHYNDKKTFDALIELEQYLKNLGISSDKDIVVSMPDMSFNSSLYRMNRHGFSDHFFISEPHANYDKYKKEEKLKKYIALGAKYLIINDTTIYKERAYLKTYTQNEIGRLKNIHIYKL